MLVSEWWFTATNQGTSPSPNSRIADLVCTRWHTSIILEGHNWIDAEKSSYIYIPSGKKHGFENQCDQKVGFMSVYSPMRIPLEMQKGMSDCDQIRTLPELHLALTEPNVIPEFRIGLDLLSRATGIATCNDPAYCLMADTVTGLVKSGSLSPTAAKT